MDRLGGVAYIRVIVLIHILNVEIVRTKVEHVALVVCFYIFRVAKSG